MPTNLSFRTVHGVDHIYAQHAQQDSEYLLIVMDVDADRINPEANEFGLIYSLGNDRVRAETRFFGYDEERTQYMVQFSVPYTGSPAQEHILGLRSGEAVMSFWYVPEMAGDDMGNTQVDLYLVSSPKDASATWEVAAIGRISDGGEDKFRTSGSIGPSVSIDPSTGYGRFMHPDDRIVIPRSVDERFFRIRIWKLYKHLYTWPPEGELIGEWIVQLPFVEELDVVPIAPDVAHVGLPRK